MAVIQTLTYRLRPRVRQTLRGTAKNVHMVKLEFNTEAERLSFAERWRKHVAIRVPEAPSMELTLIAVGSRLREDSRLYNFIMDDVERCAWSRLMPHETNWWEASFAPLGPPQNKAGDLEIGEKSHTPPGFFWAGIRHLDIPAGNERINVHDYFAHFSLMMAFFKNAFGEHSVTIVTECQVNTIHYKGLRKYGELYRGPGKLHVAGLGEVLRGQFVWARSLTLSVARPKRALR